MTEEIRKAELRKRIKRNKCLILIPTYNNARTILDVILQIKDYADDILVVNDGSTDTTQQLLERTEGIQIISYEKNRGKGYAIRCGLKEAARQAFRYMITIDSDGQHFASDLSQFMDEIEKHPDTLLIGARNLMAENMPSKNTFANKFSNFWYMAETWNKLQDTQSGYRLYPVVPLNEIRFLTDRYEFEVEVIVRSSWKGVPVRNVPVSVYYPPVGERVSHFRPGKDFFRISVLNTCLVLAAYLYYLPVKMLSYLSWKNIKGFVSKHITHSADSNMTLALSIGLGVFCGIFPVWGYQMIMAGSLAHFFKLNKVISVLSANISLPPVIPFILYGSLLLGGYVMGQNVDVRFEDISGADLSRSLFQYLVGSVFLATCCGVVSGIFSFGVLSLSRRKL